MPKINSLLEIWKNHNLTPIGRISVLKTFLISQFNHLFISIPNPSQKFLTELNSLFYNFVWNSPVDRINRDVMTKNYQEGGLKMIHLNSYVQALKTTWIRRLIHSAGKWNSIISSQVNIDKIFKVGGDFLIQVVNKLKNKFWGDVFTAWKALIDKDSEIDKTIEPAKICLWYNSHIKIGKNSVFYKKLYEKGIIHVNDLIDDSNNFLSCEQLNTKLKSNINFIDHLSLINATKQMLNNMNCKELKKVHCPYIPNNIRILLKSKSGSKDMYDILKYNLSKPVSREKWDNLFDNLNIENWKIIYKNIFNPLAGTKLHWFQYRIIHNILGTNDLLYKIKRRNDPFCTFCKQHDETILHLFWEC